MTTKRKTIATKRKGPKTPPRKVPSRVAARRTPAKPARERRKQPENLRLRSSGPGFTVNELEKSIAWYRDVLGFAVKESWEHGGKLAGAELAAGSVAFVLSQDDWKKGRDRAKGEGFRIYCTTVQDVDRLAEQIKARGGRLIDEPRDQPWGMRDFSVADPDGFKITIGTEAK